MQLKTITAAKDAGVEGIEFVKTDKAITEVIIGKLRIRKGENYNASLQVLIEAPFEEAKRHRMTATIKGFDPKVSYHDSDYDAHAASSDLPADAEITVEEVTVLLDDNGQVVTAAANGAPVDDSTIPF